MKKIPENIQQRIIALRNEGKSFRKIPEIVKEEFSGYEITRQTCSQISSGEVIGKEEALDKAGGEFSRSVIGHLDAAMERGQDAIAGILELLADPLTKNPFLKLLEENGLITDEEYEAWAEAEEGIQKQMQNQIDGLSDSLRQRTALLAGTQQEKQELQIQLQETNQELDKKNMLIKGKTEENTALKQKLAGSDKELKQLQEIKSNSIAAFKQGFVMGNNASSAKFMQMSSKELMNMAIFKSMEEQQNNSNINNTLNALLPLIMSRR